MDKKLLRWAATDSTSTVVPERSQSVASDDVAERKLLDSSRPPLPLADDFNARFDAARGKRP
jgi:hypothetical protein